MAVIYHHLLSKQEKFQWMEMKRWQKNIPYQGKKSRGKVTSFCKWLNFLQVTKFFPDFLFPDQCFSPIFFFTKQRICPNFFFQNFFFPIYLQNLLLPCFFYVLYLSWLIKAILTKISKWEWKQGIEKITITMI